jgi:anti-sigma regulatory factor (Ser/Thr protein kinase)
MAEDIQLTVPAEAASMAEVRRTFKPVLEEWSPESAEMLLLALIECCANVVSHRDPSIGENQIRIQAEREESVLRFRIDKFCRHEDVESVRPRKLDEVRPGGLGTHFVGEIMSRVSYEPAQDCPDSVTLVLEKHLSGE